jgi:hypothetical protein
MALFPFSLSLDGYAKRCSCKWAVKCNNNSAMQNVDLSPTLERFKGLWVALTDSDSVISANKSAKKAYDEAIKKDTKNLSFSKCHSTISLILANLLWSIRLNTKL